MNARTVIAPHGDLDIATMGDFREAPGDEVRDGAGMVVVDLSEVDFVDSSGLGAIMEMYERLRHGERELAIVVPPGSAAAVVLNLTGLSSRLPVVDCARWRSASSASRFVAVCRALVQRQVT